MNTASLTASSDVSMPTDFNLRSPRGNGAEIKAAIFDRKIFQSTFPARGTAAEDYANLLQKYIGN